MKQTDILNIKERIESDIRKTKLAITQYTELTKPVEPDNAIGRVSRMDAINNKSVIEAALRKAAEKLANLQYLLTQIQEDDFGKCAKCKHEIPIDRILFRPESRFCVHCAV